jgi:hypothetical protein
VSRSGRTYRLYGLAVRSPLALPCPRWGGPPDVRLAVRRKGDLAPPAGDDRRTWFSYHQLADGSTHLRWRGLAEFLISRDGSSIGWRALAPGTQEAFRGYLLAQVLSFSLLARGREPLHASAVTAGGGAIAFLGDCGAGKSSLTAAFLRAGHRLVTDDLLVLGRRQGGYAVEPGVGRIKLFPTVARRLLGKRRVAPRMTPGTTKLVLPLPHAMTVRRPLPLHTLYLLARGRSVRVTDVTPAAALLEILRDAFNTVSLDPARLARQFRFARAVATRVRIRRVFYPRRFAVIDQVRDAILRDLAGASRHP